MEWVVGGLMVLVLVVGLVHARRGRLRLRGCCAADPARDLRMRAAFLEDQGGD